MVSLNEHICPACGGELRYYDTIRRMIKKEGGLKAWVLLPRAVCQKCGRIHRELPEDILPYKHYTKTIIDGFLTGDFSTLDLEFEDYPSEGTVANWKAEFGQR